jgi:predicted lipoprotein with Yx(FWY)xxD motif
MMGKIFPSSKYGLLQVAVLLVLTTAGCSSNGGIASTSPNVTIPTSTAPATTIVPTTTTTPMTTTPPTSTLPVTTLPPTTTFPPATTSSYSVNIASKTIIGNYLTDSRGLALYYTTSDRPNYSNLPDETLTNWPVFYTPVVTAGPGLNTSDFGTYTRDSGKKQTTYKGYPLYSFVQDKSSGDTVGNNLGGVWFVAKP